MDFIYQTINILADLLIILIFAKVLLSWFVRDRSHPVVRHIDAIVEPILQPIRRSLPRLGMIDLSPLIAYFLIEFGRRIIITLLF
jgi:YggT family protein